MNPLSLTNIEVVIGKERVRIFPPVIAKFIVQSSPCVSTVFMFAVSDEIAVKPSNTIYVFLTDAYGPTALLANMLLASNHEAVIEEFIAHRLPLQSSLSMFTIITVMKNTAHMAAIHHMTYSPVRLARLILYGLVVSVSVTVVPKGIEDAGYALVADDVAAFVRHAATFSIRRRATFAFIDASGFSHDFTTETLPANRISSIALLSFGEL